jgi:hypothetical protein
MKLIYKELNEIIINIIAILIVYYNYEFNKILTYDQNIVINSPTNNVFVPLLRIKEEIKNEYNL